MKTFTQYLRDTNRLDEGLMDFFRGKKHVEPTPPADDPVSKWKAMRQKSTLGQFDKTGPDQDAPADDGEADVMAAMSRKPMRSRKMSNKR
jgi:hypothetical protein